MEVFDYYGYLVPKGQDAEDWIKSTEHIRIATRSGVMPYFLAEPYTTLNDTRCFYPELETWDEYMEKSKDWRAYYEWKRGLCL